MSKIPNQIEFSYNKHGKPFVPEKYNNHSLEFNISHSDIYGLIAITLDNKIGVDIQRVNHDINIDSLSERFFSEDEKEDLKTITNNIIDSISILIDKKLDLFSSTVNNN